MNKKLSHAWMMRVCQFLSGMVLILTVSAATAQSHTDHQPPTAVATSATLAAQPDHADHAQATEPAVPVAVDASSHDHSSMPSQDVSMPMKMDMDNAAIGAMRDPHAYANGYQIGTGLYALEGPHLHMADEMHFGGFRMSRLEQLFQDGKDTTVYDGQAWYGNSYNRLVVKADGEERDGSLEDSEIELLWSHAFAKFWDTQFGLRVDSGEGPGRSWIAAGVQGVAPYWFEVGVTAYLGENGRTALNLEIEYDLLLSQRLILQPRVEMNFHGKEDAPRGIGSGLTDTAAGLRLHYQINRQLVPYLGIERVTLHGKTANFAGARAGSSETRWLAGLRFWF